MQIVIVCKILAVPSFAAMPWPQAARAVGMERLVQGAVGKGMVGGCCALEVG